MKPTITSKSSDSWGKTLNPNGLHSGGKKSNSSSQKESKPFNGDLETLPLVTVNQLAQMTLIELGVWILERISSGNLEPRAKIPLDSAHSTKRKIRVFQFTTRGEGSSVSHAGQAGTR